jgi:hypothetical protein
MVRQVNVVVPHDHASDVLEALQRCPSAYKVVRFDSVHYSHINFKTKPKNLQETMLALAEVGCGENYGTIDVLSVVMTRPSIAFKEAGVKKNRAYRINDRISIDEIHEAIDDGNHLTFDFIAMVAVASVIAGAGLLSDNATTVIASMLVSPLMGPILSITFGLATVNYSVVRRGFRNELVGVFISLFTGIVMGLFAATYYKPDFRSGEITSRGSGDRYLFIF